MLPRSRSFDETFAFLQEGYEFIGNRCERLDACGFQTRIMLKPVVCVRGAAAAEQFYAPGRFTRKRAMPITALKLLQDFGSLQLLDGSAHRHRKSMFLSLARAEGAEALSRIFRRQLLAAIASSPADKPIVISELMVQVLTAAAVEWVGLSLDMASCDRLSYQLSEAIEAAGQAGPRNWRAQWLRSQAERWARGIVRQVRSGQIRVTPVSPLAHVCGHRDIDGALLSDRVAAVELLNLLRPIVAVGRYIVFAIAMLDSASRRRVLSGETGYVFSYAQEVRRWSPFFPVVGGVVREPFVWLGHTFDKDQWVLLDLFGTNRDARTWPEPTMFKPERFLVHTPTLYDLVPQGGGNAALTHRCPGESLTIALIAEAVRTFASDLVYQIPPQDLSIDLSRIPGLPASGVILQDLRLGPPASTRLSASQGGR